ncbi:dTDP-D-glucose 4,6-dehydratase [Strongyloides ratti]|uniref:dTDP-D-glucose 4,6-dehydratase n=1 Tax=Strongyloides ratti TaxID=34506 RepID=A0A090MZ99_STRRB|nr:dTDP-D-glucose 4,6-dehydratase [Strongyloides ratti]CEF68564.1 dTDP-D-glucose 4,6-dehydratase [Strongyloides ratti]
MKSILITGGLGYLGTNFANYLLSSQDKPSIVILDKVSKNSSLERLNNKNDISIIIGDISNELLVKKIIENYNIDTIFNFAFDTNIEESFIDMIGYCRNNFEGLTHLLDGVRHSSNSSKINFIHISTEDVYGTSKIWSETEPTYPLNPVAANHGSCEMMLNAYAKGYHINIKIARLAKHVYGGKMGKNNIIKSIVQTNLAPSASEILSPLYIDDAIKGILAVAETPDECASIYNIPSAICLTEESLKEFCNNGKLKEETVKMSSDKIFKKTNWKPIVTLEEGINKIKKEPTTSSVIENNTKLAKFLIFGGKGWIGNQFCELLRKNNIEYVVSQTKPGFDKDETVESEIVAVAPSNVVSMIGRTQGPGCGNISYLEGGPDKLNENIRDNCFGPWILGKMCQKFKIHYTYLGTGCIFQYNEEHGYTGPGYKELDDGNFKNTSYSAVKLFTDRLLRPLDNCLNARIRLPVNYENSPRNLAAKMIMFNKVIDIPNSITILPDCLPVLLNLSLEKSTGTINLVNPGPINFTEFKEIYNNLSGKNEEYEVLDVSTNKEMVNTRAHCILDTGKIIHHKPDIRSAVEGVKEAYQKILNIN